MLAFSCLPFGYAPFRACLPRPPLGVRGLCLPFRACPFRASFWLRAFSCLPFWFRAFFVPPSLLAFLFVCFGASFSLFPPRSPLGVWGRGWLLMPRLSSFLFVCRAFWFLRLPACLLGFWLVLAFWCALFVLAFLLVACVPSCAYLVLAAFYVCLFL